MASTSHDGESAYMLGLIRTSVPIHSPHHNECGSSKTHNCIQTWDTDRESAFLTTIAVSCKKQLTTLLLDTAVSIN